MANILFRQGKQNIGNKQIAFNADTFKATLLNMNTAGGKIALVNAASNATPIVITTTASHGYTTGDVLVVGGVGGNLAANGTWQVGTTTSNTFQLLTLLDGNNSTGSAAYTSGGYCIDITTAAALSDVSANTNGTDATLSSVTNTGGTINSANFTWTGLSATQVSGTAIYDSGNNDLIAWVDGRFQIYVVTQAASTSTSIAIQRLPVVIANGTVITFSDGASATLTAQANVGDTSLTVSSTAATIHRQATADVPTGTGATANGFPMTPASGGSLQFTVDTGVNKLFVI